MVTRDRLNDAVDRLIRNNPNTRRKLILLGYGDPEFVKKKLEEIKRKANGRTAKL